MLDCGAKLALTAMNLEGWVKYSVGIFMGLLLPHIKMGGSYLDKEFNQLTFSSSYIKIN